MWLRSLTSEDREDNRNIVDVEAELVTQTRNDYVLEQIISRLSLEPGGGELANYRAGVWLTYPWRWQWFLGSPKTT